MSEPFGTCPLPLAHHPTVQLAHGGGGRMMHQLIENVILPALGDQDPDNLHDGAVFTEGGARLAFSTDSYVVQPLFFPGGDIGSLAVNGTVNDLAMCGAQPLYLSVGFIVEEGLPLETLRRVLASMRAAADLAQVRLVTGDTKVVDRGKGDGLFINTAGIGRITHGLAIAPRSVRPGDALLLSGDLGRHGIAIMAQREGIAFESTIQSDCAPLAAVVADLLAAGLPIHCLRDLTRGGLSSGLVEIATAARLHLRVDGPALPVHEDVRGACELLGLDPMVVANEGCMLVILPEEHADAALGRMRAHAACARACRIGTVRDDDPGLVTLTSAIGAERIVDMLSGEQLPRIC